MPGTYKPTITNYPKGVVSIESASEGITYAEIQQSFSAYFFKIYNLYYYAATIQQLVQPLRFLKFDVNGNRIGFPEVIAPDPYQTQTAINIALANKQIIFNGQYYFELPLLALQQVYMIFDVEELALHKVLPKSIFFENSFFGKFTDVIDADKFHK